MKTRNHIVETGAQDGFTAEILELYEWADETTRMNLYMTHRDLRERFDRIETAGTA